PIVQVSGISSNASLTLNAANSVTVNADIVLAGGDINVTTGSATGAMTVNSATVRTDGAMHLDLAGALVVQTANASDARLHASAGQAISARSVVVTTSGSGSASISNGAGGQTIAVNNANAGSGIDVVSTGSGVARISNGFSDDGLPIARPGPQSITIDDGDRLQVIGRGGTAMIESAADQFIALRGTGANQIVLGAANAAGSALIQASGSQFVSAGSRGQRGGVTLVGGVAEGTSASIRTIGPLGSQNVSTSGTISAVGGSAIGSEGPSASADAGIRHEGAGPQVISAESIVLRGGTGGGTDNDGFIASIEGAQFINAGVGGITLVGGSGGDGNDAHITQFGIASPQTITVATGGSIVLQGGSSPGFGKRAAITAFGPSQLIEFVDPGSGQASAAGVSTPSGDASLAAASATRSRVSAPGGGIVVIGGSVGAANEATIVSDGTQTITGSPDLTLTGGASGGQRGSGNAATIRSSVSQDFTLGTVQLSGGAGGIDNYASIEAPIQSIST
ncbi:MAG: hypothetical protein ACXW2I_20955, partial [Burkholderiales bacterium]